MVAGAKTSTRDGGNKDDLFPLSILFLGNWETTPKENTFLAFAFPALKDGAPHLPSLQMDLIAAAASPQ